MTIPKYVNHQGKVGVITCFLARVGWYTEHKVIEAVFDPDIINVILCENGDHDKIYQIAVKKYGQKPYQGASHLKVDWIKPNLEFSITMVYDHETIIIKKDYFWLNTNIENEN